MRFALKNMVAPTINANYDRNLKILYGENYMTSVQASSEHGGMIFDTDKSYTWYLNQRK